VSVSAELRRYRPPTTRRDVLAGVTVAAPALPSAKAYGELAGLSPLPVFTRCCCPPLPTSPRLVEAPNHRRGRSRRRRRRGPLALYDPGIKDAAQQYADRLGRRSVVDISNPVDTQTWDRLATEPGSSSAEEVAQLVPRGAPVVKAFNTTVANTLVDGKVEGQPLDVLIAGDDEEAKQKVSHLVSDGGLRAIDWAPQASAAARALGLLHITLQEPRSWPTRRSPRGRRERPSSRRAARGA
jgi:hypothetical protein